MQKVAAGDASAFRMVSDQHLRAILAYANRLLKTQAEAEEVCQEVFIRAWQNAASYKPKARLSTWLHAITHHLCVDRMRRAGFKREPAAFDAERHAAPRSHRPSLLLERKALAASIADALNALPARQKEAIVLCHEHGMSNSEIGVVMGIGVEAVESLLARGRRGLRQLLSPNKASEA